MNWLIDCDELTDGLSLYACGTHYTHTWCYCMCVVCTTCLMSSIMEFVYSPRVLSSCSSAQSVSCIVFELHLRYWAESIGTWECRDLPRSHWFCPLSIEFMGAMGPRTLELVRDVGRRIAMETGEPRSTDFLLQNLWTFLVICEYGWELVFPGACGITLDAYLVWLQTRQKPLVSLTRLSHRVESLASKTKIPPWACSSY